LKRECLETINSILEWIQRFDPVQQEDLTDHMQEDGIRYPEKALTRLQEEVTDRLSQF
jgi:hypothetical protein